MHCHSRAYEAIVSLKYRDTYHDDPFDPFLSSVFLHGSMLHKASMGRMWTWITKVSRSFRKIMSCVSSRRDSCQLSRIGGLGGTLRTDLITSAERFVNPCTVNLRYFSFSIFCQMAIFALSKIPTRFLFTCCSNKATLRPPIFRYRQKEPKCFDKLNDEGTSCRYFQY